MVKNDMVKKKPASTWIRQYYTDQTIF
jgi:hypothetical protein